MRSIRLILAIKPGQGTEPAPNAHDRDPDTKHEELSLSDLRQHQIHSLKSDITQGSLQHKLKGRLTVS